MAKNPISRLIRILRGDPLESDDLSASDGGLSKLEKFIHFWVLVCQSFVRNRLPVRASALSYTSLLAMIPVLAVTMSVTSVFLKEKGEDQIQHFIEEFVNRIVPDVNVGTNNNNEYYGPFLPTEMPVMLTETNSTEAATNDFAQSTLGATNAPDAGAEWVTSKAQQQAATFIHQFIQHTYSGTLGATGFLFLLITAIMTVTSVEKTLNDIWGVSRGRNWLARVPNYLSAITFGTAAFVAAMLAASGPRFEKTRELMTAIPFLETLVSHLLPVFLICISFALFYKLLPNTKVHFSAAFVGGALAGTAWHLFNTYSFVLASKAINWSKIYGSLALIPLFMFGLYVVWLVVLFGAQVAYAFQNRAAYLQEKLVENVNQRGREFVALRLMTCISQRFQGGQPPPTIQQLSSELGVPSRLVQQVIQTLVAARLVIEVAGSDPAYAPARPLDTINCHHILLAMRATVGQELLTRDEPVREEVLGEFARIQAVEKQAAASVTMLGMVSRARSRLQLASGDHAATEDSVAETSAVDQQGAKDPSEPPTPVFPTEEIPTGLADDLANENPSEDDLASEPEPSKSTTPELRTDSDEDERGFPL